MPSGSPKIVIDTSALISLALGSIVELVLKEFSVVISNLVLNEIEELASFNDDVGNAARTVLSLKNLIEIRTVNVDDVKPFLTSRVQIGEASCIVLVRNPETMALITDDFRAMHHLRSLSHVHNFELGLGAVLIRALLLRDKLNKTKALEVIDNILVRRNWLGGPIYRAYKKILLDI